MQTQSSPGLLLPVSPTGGEVHWYAAYTRPNHEKSVAQQLGLRNIEQVLPLYNSVRQWKDRRVRLATPLFPGYVFVHISLRERLQVLGIPGVACLVGSGNRPTPLPEEDILSIQCCLSRETGVEPHHYPCVGNRVRVKNGPLSGLTGVVVRIKNRTRLVLTFDLIRRSATVEVDQIDLEPIQRNGV
jgi:transcription antitermination factor NusG